MSGPKKVVDPNHVLPNSVKYNEFLPPSDDSRATRKAKLKYIKIFNSSRRKNTKLADNAAVAIFDKFSFEDKNLQPTSTHLILLIGREPFNLEENSKQRKKVFALLKHSQMAGVIANAQALPQPEPPNFPQTQDLTKKHIPASYCEDELIDAMLFWGNKELITLINDDELFIELLTDVPERINEVSDSILLEKVKKENKKLAYSLLRNEHARTVLNNYYDEENRNLVQPWYKGLCSLAKDNYPNDFFVLAYTYDYLQRQKIPTDQLQELSWPLLPKSGNLNDHVNVDAEFWGSVRSFIEDNDSNAHLLDERHIIMMFAALEPKLEVAVDLDSERGISLFNYLAQKALPVLLSSNILKDAADFNSEKQEQILKSIDITKCNYNDYIRLIASRNIYKLVFEQNLLAKEERDNGFLSHNPQIFGQLYGGDHRHLAKLIAPSPDENQKPFIANPRKFLRRNRNHISPAAWLWAVPNLHNRLDGNDSRARKTISYLRRSKADKNHIKALSKLRIAVTMKLQTYEDLSSEDRKQLLELLENNKYYGAINLSFDQKFAWLCYVMQSDILLRHEKDRIVKLLARDSSFLDLYNEKIPFEKKSLTRKPLEANASQEQQDRLQYATQHEFLKAALVFRHLEKQYTYMNGWLQNGRKKVVNELLKDEAKSGTKDYLRSVVNGNLELKDYLRAVVKDNPELTEFVWTKQWFGFWVRRGDNELQDLRDKHHRIRHMLSLNAHGKISSWKNYDRLEQALQHSPSIRREYVNEISQNGRLEDLMTLAISGPNNNEIIRNAILSEVTTAINEWLTHNPKMLNIGDVIQWYNNEKTSDAIKSALASALRSHLKIVTDYSVDDIFMYRNSAKGEIKKILRDSLIPEVKFNRSNLFMKNETSLRRKSTGDLRRSIAGVSGFHTAAEESTFKPSKSSDDSEISLFATRGLHRR